MKSILCILCLTLVVVVRSVEDFGNSYNCGGTKQSPIDLKTQDLVKKKYNDLKWNKDYGKIPIKMIATGGGSLTIGSEYTNNTVPTLWGGPLSTEYKIVQFHFHWAQKDHIGSEHLVNGHSYIMEMHAVHIKKNLSFEQASQDKNDGIAVIGYFFEYSAFASHAIDHLIEVFAAIKGKKNAPVTLPHPFALKELIRPISCNYVTYRGSLTTPPCTENVLWIVSPYPNPISRKQMARFRDLAQNNGVTMDNYRNLQQRNGRQIYYATRKVSLHDYIGVNAEGKEYAIDDIYNDGEADNFADDAEHYGKN